ncbi:hypothetical protein GTQ34_16050 [Muricauda sp. JGD-17]|uniref:Peptidase S74 domain-containing protein n=1 Tax=Flagellimonas ochracea TaxID=2696472 RepID=A0A964TEG7_9FLAO|nr:tail fiber protein [Allomuricauda ochracea]NAY93424.1 hypothetical protein [Allomuricauda ochracea]
MKIKRNLLYCFMLFLGIFSFGQTSTFDNLNANPLTGKAITWTSSNYGNGFGHRIVNSDPGYFTLLNIQGRHNSTTWTDMLSITTLGNIGIGTSSPTSLLHVTSGTSGDAILRIESDTDNNNEFDNPLIEFSQDGDVVGAFVGFSENFGENLFGIGTKYPNTVGLRWDSFIINPVNGYVGIGSSAPDSKLTVKGNIHAEEVKVDLSVPGPDYVFKDGYKLKSLEEVHSYIKEHGHLSNIPSAKEMEANGIDLGEMNMKLLEKIEELTLYLLIQQKQLKRLQSEVQNLNR